MQSNHVSEKTNGVVESKKSVKRPQKKQDEVEQFLEKSFENAEQSNESDGEAESDKEEITEEQFLNEQNLMTKEQLLLDSSAESDDQNDSESDIADPNPKRKEFYDSDDFDDDKATSESDESLIEQFLATDKSKPITSKETTPQKTKEVTLGGETKKRPIPIPSVNAIANGSDSDEVDEPTIKKPKTVIGANIFANIEKDDEIELSSDENEGNNNITKKPKVKTKDQSPDSSNMLDTSMFKSTKTEVSTKQLSKLLTTSRNKSTARVSPDEPIMVKDSDEDSDDDSDVEHVSTEKNENADEDKEKRVKRKLLRDDQLADDTKHAQREEQDRIKRLEKKNERLTQYISSQKSLSQQSNDSDAVAANELEVILDYDSKKKEKIVVHREITKHLKAHQVDGIKFMFDCCYGAVDNMEKYPGSGCILAHCMGLGKTLQLISLLHTVISYPQLKTNRILVICPKSTVMNWKEEIERWIGQIKGSRKLKLFIFPEQS